MPTVTVCHSLLPTSYACTVIRPPRGRLTLRNRRGFPRSTFMTDSGLGACYRPGSVWTTRTQALSVLPTSITVWSSVTTTYACRSLRSLSQIQISSPYHLSSTHPICGYPEGMPLAIYAPRFARWYGRSPTFLWRQLQQATSCRKQPDCMTDDFAEITKSFIGFHRAII